MYKIDLAPDGRLRLWYDDTISVIIPRSFVGLTILSDILTAKQLAPNAKLASPTKPVQSTVDAAVREWKKLNPVKPIIELEGIEELLK